MAIAELSRIQRKLFLRASRERVWRALTNIEEFSQWFQVEAIGKFEPGAKVQMTSTHESCKGLEFSITVDQMTPGQVFSWRWRPGIPEPGVDYAAEPMTLVEFRLEEVAGDTEVTVSESGFDRISAERRAKLFAENDRGWEIQMASLAHYVDRSV